MLNKESFFRQQHQNMFILSITLSLIYILAFLNRLYSILKWESVIHEYDPYFNYRTTQYLINHNFTDFINWFDDQAWYPLGRVVGGTLYPGLMLTAAAVYKVLRFLHFTVDIRNVCVLLAPWMASNTTLAMYLLTKEVAESKACGLLAAAFVAIVPSYISRSSAGSYDNEGVAIFALVLTFYFWIKAMKKGSLFWSALCCLAYFYMVSAWGGYVFITNIIPLHVIALVVTGRFSYRVYIAYTTFFSMGTIMALCIPFVGFQAITSSEHLLSYLTFFGLNLFAIYQYLLENFGAEKIKKALMVVAAGVSVIGAFAIFIGIVTGKISPWTGRFWSLLDPTYAKKYIPIIASVSEHQPTTWTSYYLDLNLLAIGFPAGLYYCIYEMTDAKLFVLIFGLFSIYFASVMIRLMLVLAPAACILSAIAFTEILNLYSKMAKGKGKYKDLKDIGFSALFFVGFLFFLYVQHSVWVASEVYSSPSIVVNFQNEYESGVLDDFREAYSWISKNTHPDAKVMSWWDYGYQLAAMANRTTIVDNNTWNNTHISQVGQVMAGTEDVAYEILDLLDIDYVLVVFGGVVGYGSDDINKFPWMIRIGGTTNPNLIEKDYYNAKNEYRIDEEGAAKLHNSVIYKLTYFNFDLYPSDKGPGFDRVRQKFVGVKNIQLKHFEEAYTSSHWVVRIYRVKKHNRDSLKI